MIARSIAVLLMAVLCLPALRAGAQTSSSAQTSPSAQTTAEAPAADSKSNLDLLLDVIENDQSRAALIDELRAAQGRGDDNVHSADQVADSAVTALAPQGVATPPETLSFGRRIALITQSVAEGTAHRLTSTWGQLQQSPAVFDGLNGSEVSVLLEALKELALIIVTTVVVFLILRRMGRSIYARMGASAKEGGVVRTVALFCASALIDALLVVVAWAVGYLVATLVLGNFGQIGIRQTLYLNAFLLVELVKVVIRMVLSPSARNLRPLPISDTGASYLTSRLNLMVGLVGYGQLLIVPIINSNVSAAGGRAISALIAVLVVAIAAWLVMRNRKPVAQWLARGGQTQTEEEAQAELARDAQKDLPQDSTPDEFPQAQPHSGPKRGSFDWISRHWHWAAMAYLGLMLVLVLSSGDAAFQSLIASGQVLIMAIVGVAVSGILTRIMVRGVVLPDNLTARLPLLESRLNRFVPKALFVLRLAIFVLVVVFAMNAISVIDLKAWLASQIGLRLTSTIFSVAMVLLVSFGIWVAMTSWVDYRLNPEFGSVATSREQTLLTLMRNAATIALVIITLMFVLSKVGLDIAPLLASAGVLGLAIGFGAQKLVQDIITGIFIQFENAMNVGDVVTVGGTTGVVERLTIRSTSLRDVSGVFHVIPFSSVDMVSNYMRDFGYFVCDMGVAYRENIEDVKQAMLDAFDELRADPEHAANIMADLEWFGVNSFGDSAVVCRARIKCVPGKQWGVGRAYNGVLKTVFDARNIEIPFPHQTIYLGEAKDGKTQPFHVTMDTQEGAAQT
ncbi:mechanosensitive ion channel protein MscS [Thioclava sp. SK-1]|uniref:mechanosensitive ion channel domain-containing protein n=1 Tax=Thioclava sp. SK-1 TaxID=1889770 RepID=UPI0008245C35|nr:mechanosensitive ion channel domain-containing protein [Thioclava sp. SK-1]OCX64497.1 mechanosensitive ion channel protein MscS [Thioclava sp. SK-1]